MKKTILLVSILFSQFMLGNNLKEYLGDGISFVEGIILNYPELQNDMTMSIVVEGYFAQNSVEILINKDGSFKAEIPITDIQDLFLGTEQGWIRFFTFKNDTIRMEFSYDAPIETMKLSGISENRSKDLALCLSLSKHGNSNSPAKIKNMMVNPSFSDSIRKEKLNQYYNERVEIIDSFISKNSNTEFKDKFINDVYYETCEIALFRGTSLLSAINNGRSHDTFRLLSEDFFRISSVYRNYLSRYIFTNSVSPYALSNYEDKGEGISELRKQYYYALSQLEMPWVRDWYITERFIMQFPNSELPDIEFALEDFKKICQNKSYIEKLEEIHSNLSSLYNATSAPNFKLKNEKGEFVSLSDFAGRIVYIDFWDSYCGPCIYEFMNYDKKFHEKYKDNNIVHIYICFSNDEKQWKDDIKKYDLQGTNLITESEKNNKLYKDYSFYGFPHYILISSNGKIFKNGCERPSEMLNSTQNTLDKLLKIEN